MQYFLSSGRTVFGKSALACAMHDTTRMPNPNLVRKFFMEDLEQYKTHLIAWQAMATSDKNFKAIHESVCRTAEYAAADP